MRSYSTSSAAELLGVTRHTVHRWVVDGVLPAYDIGTPGRPRLRITEAALQAFIAARSLGPTAA